MNRHLLKSKAKSILRKQFGYILLLVVLTSILCFDFISMETSFDSYGNGQAIYLNILSLEFKLSATPLLLAVMAIMAIAGLLYSIFFSSVLQYGLANKLKHIALGDNDQFDLFSGFRTNYKNVVMVHVMTNLYIFLFSLLLVIPGIIKSFEYQYVYEVLDDHPNWHWKKVLAESKRLTYGHKWELFVLGLSFFGWALLVGLLNMITLGLASYLLEPYMRMTDTQAYLWLKEIDEQRSNQEMFYNENVFINY